ncbi:MAG TPA: class I SAM-dependent methyltransferase [Spongiibacteraceae bacterium]|nr:class I SAM-dependent methyltransferase [Spongiibacteraceae bacterium]
MSFYEDKILPHIIDSACSMEPVMQLRAKVVPLASGEVLEVGMGSGINLALYNASRVEKVWGLEPSLGMRDKAQKNLANSPVPVTWLSLRGEEIPLPDNSVDSVVLTFTLCSIPDWKLALQQMWRTLKPDGKLLFCEHGRAPEINIQKWQDRITPVWKKFAGGCHLNRPVKSYLEEGGFAVEEIHNLYVDKAPRVTGYVSYGVATKA